MNWPFSICIYAHSESAFNECSKRIQALGLPKPLSIFWCDSRSMSREQFFLQRPFRWMLFVDADCQLRLDMLNQMAVRLELYAKLRGESTAQILTGCYENLKESKYLQRVHNLIANLWVKKFYKQKCTNKAFLGGVFLVYHELEADHVCSRKEIALGQYLWGGEEERLARVLRQSPFSFVFNLDEDLAVVHLCSYRMSHFLKRAWVHGINKVKYQDLQQQDASLNEFAYSESLILNLFYFFKNIYFRDLFLLPGVVLHFSVQKAGWLFQKVRQLHSIKWIKRILNMKSPEIHQQRSAILK